MKLSRSDIRYLEAAEGWLDLGDWKSAHEELDSLPGGLGGHSSVLAMRFRAYSAARNWELALKAAEACVTTNPDDPQAWIHRSFALHELKRTQEAQSLLLPAAEKFPRIWVIPYNLACYACTLGEIDKARTLLKQALKLGDAAEIRRMAREDPDLAALWVKAEGQS